MPPMTRLLPALALFVGLPLALLAHSGASGVVKERMEGMKQLAASMKALKAQIDGKPDPARIETLGRTIGAHAGPRMTMRFPEGSGGGVSEAHERIWEDFAGFEAEARRLEARAARLVALAGAMREGEAGRDELRAAFADLARSCKDCHATYRLPK